MTPRLRRALALVLVGSGLLTACGLGGNRTQGLFFGLVVGVVANDAAPGDIAAARHLGAPVVRLEMPIEATTADVARYVEPYARAGIRVLLLAGFPRRMPSDLAARALGGWAAAFGPRSGSGALIAIEIGNETSYTYQYGDAPSSRSYGDRAGAYARLVEMASASIHQADRAVQVLAQADDGGTGTSAWVDSMFRAVPDLAGDVSGWTVHPYGPRPEERLGRTLSNLRVLEWTRPLWITEWGVATDDRQCLEAHYGWPRCMDSERAAEALERLVGALPRYPVQALMLYQAHDQRSPGADPDPEHYFGLTTVDGRDKGRYTSTARSLWDG